MAGGPGESKIEPYIGPRPFESGEPIFGRDREQRELASLLRSRRIVLMYSPSGAGKTSLIQAGLLPLMKREGFQVLPVIRVNELPTAASKSEDVNRYRFSVLASLESGGDISTRKRLSDGALIELSNRTDGLVAYLADRPDRRTSRNQRSTARSLLIFDQFEEILTADPMDQAGKRDFFESLLPVLSDVRVMALFAMREDYIAGLDPYLIYFPERLSARFRLDLLDQNSALDAIRSPARRFKVNFVKAAAQELVSQLSKITIFESGQRVEIDGLYVEPVQLQVVCKRLWEAERAHPKRITLQDFPKGGWVVSALRDYYDDKVGEVAKSTRKPELYLREWIEQRLISPQRLRSQVMEGQENEFGLDADAIYQLSRVYLVRLDQRRNITWYELAHDRLIEPILQANREWRQQRRIVFRTAQELGTNLEDTGWGVIFPANADPDLVQKVLEALKPLLQLRESQAVKKSKQRFHIFSQERGYHPGETGQSFLERHQAGLGQFNPDLVPYNLLIVASPEEIPFEFQYGLDVQYAVGRITFERLEEYEIYARSVALCESGKLRLPNWATIFAPENPDDRATQMSAKELAGPLVRRLGEARPDWDVRAVLSEEATKARLARLLGGEETPAVLLTVSHAMVFTPADQRQIQDTGAILCQDWPGPKGWKGPLPPDFYFSGADLSEDARLLGMVAFIWGSHSAGMTSEDREGKMQSRFGGYSSPQGKPAPYSFLARLPQRLLSHPLGGALATIAISWKGWNYAFKSKDQTREYTIFDYTLERLMEGYTVGRAMEFINRRSSMLASQFGELVQEIMLGEKGISNETSRRVTEYLDARDFIVIGDPAVRLPVDPSGLYVQPEKGWRRPSLGELTGFEAQIPVGEGIAPQIVEAENLSAEKEDYGLIEKEAVPVEEKTTGIPEETAAPAETKWYFNGINGISGRAWVEPVSLDRLVNVILGEPIDPDELAELRFLVVSQSRVGVRIVDWDPLRLNEAGWGVILGPGSDPRVMEALKPLLELRQRQSGGRFRVFEGPDGYQTGESARSFCERWGLSPGLVDPAKIPYYLMIVGAPDSIPYSFQADLSRRLAVGRLWFEDWHRYHTYAAGVVRVGEGVTKRSELPRLSLFAPQPTGDRVSQLMVEKMAAPLANDLHSSLSTPWLEVNQVGSDSASKQALMEILKNQRPDLLFLIGQGLVYPRESLLARERQGGFVCQDWPGPNSGSAWVTENTYLQAHDLDDEYDLSGMLVFLLNSYGLGSQRTAHKDEVLTGIASQAPQRPFVSRLPERMLSIGESKGALGVFGPVTHTWSPVPGYWPPTPHPLPDPRSFIKQAAQQLMHGSPAGHVLRSL